MRYRFDRDLFLQAGAAALLVCFSAFPALAQSRETNARLSRIETDIQTLSRAVFKGDMSGGMIGGGADSANVESRLTQIEMDIQNLTGKIEEQGYELQRLKDEYSAAQARASGQAGMSQAVNGGMAGHASADTYAYDGPPQPMQSNIQQQSVPRYEDGGNELSRNGKGNGIDYVPPGGISAGAGATGQLGSMAVTVDQSGNITGTARDAQTAAYEDAFAMLRNQDYAGAQSAFDRFIKQNPDHQLVPNAMYWLGETYYVRGDFDRAVRIFADAYQKYPKGAKAPDNLLKLGMALAGQGKPKDACVALSQLKKEYPAGAAPVLSRGDQEMARLNCGTL